MQSNQGIGGYKAAEKEVRRLRVEKGSERREGIEMGRAAVSLLSWCLAVDGATSLSVAESIDGL